MKVFDMMRSRWNYRLCLLSVILISLIQYHYAFVQLKLKSLATYHGVNKHHIPQHTYYTTHHHYHNRATHEIHDDEALTRKEMLEYIFHTTSILTLTNQVFTNNPVHAIGLPKKEKPQLEFCLVAVLRVSNDLNIQRRGFLPTSFSEIYSKLVTLILYYCNHYLIGTILGTNCW